jgi:membrane protein DedA with SNARE-associated domain
LRSARAAAIVAIVHARALIFCLAAAIALTTVAVAVPDPAGTFSGAAASLDRWIYPAVAALIFVETSVLLGFVVHGELVLLVAGLTAERGDASLGVLIGLAAAGALAGDTVSWKLGRRLGRPFLEERIDLSRVDGFFARHGAKAIVLGRFTGFLRATMPFVAGSSGLALRRLLPLSAVSAVAWTALYLCLGYAFSESISGTATWMGTGVVLAVAAAFFIRSRIPRASGSPAAARPAA